MRTLIFVGLLALSTLVQANAAELLFAPSVQAVSPGSTIAFDVVISGLARPPSVGAFDLTVSFDSALLAPVGVTFGTLLGDPVTEAFTGSSVSGSSFEFAEVSLLSSGDLDALQPSSFSLATLNFSGIGSGTAALAFSKGVVDDAFGNKLVTIPEPGTASLLVIFSFVVRVFRRRILYK